MKFFFLISLLVVISCSNKDENLVDVNSFINQGKKIDLANKTFLNSYEINKINSLDNFKYFHLSNFGVKINNINPNNISIDKPIRKLSKKLNKFNIYKKFIITVDNKSNVELYDLNFKKIISKKLYDKKTYKKFNIIFSLLAYKDKIYISDNLGNIHCLDIKSLKIIWKKSYSVPFRSNIKIYENNLFLINSNSKLYSINAQNGNLNWSFETTSKDLKDNKSYNLQIYNSKLIFTNDSAEIYCIDLKTNNILWSLVFESSNFTNSPLIFKSSPMIIDLDGSLYISNNLGNTYKINIENGMVIWTAPIFSINDFLLTNNYLLNVINNNFFIINKKNGKVLFNKKFVLDNKNFNIKNIIISTEYIYLFEKNGYVISIDRKNFKIIKYNKFLGDFLDLIVSKDNLIIRTKKQLIQF